MSSAKDGIDLRLCQSDYPLVLDKTTEIRVVPATGNDVALIRAFILELAEYEKAQPGDVVVTDAMLLDTLFGARPAAEVIIAYSGDEPVGFALFFHNYSTWLANRGLYLEDLFVRPSARKLGAGYALLQALARIAVERKCGRMEWSVLKWNQLAISFYDRIGAREMNEWVGFRLTGNSLLQLAGTRD